MTGIGVLTWLGWGTIFVTSALIAVYFHMKYRNSWATLVAIVGALFLITAMFASVYADSHTGVLVEGHAREETRVYNVTEKNITVEEVVGRFLFWRIWAPVEVPTYVLSFENPESTPDLYLEVEGVSVLHDATEYQYLVTYAAVYICPEELSFWPDWFFTCVNEFAGNRYELHLLP